MAVSSSSQPATAVIMTHPGLVRLVPTVQKKVKLLLSFVVTGAGAGAGAGAPGKVCFVSLAVWQRSLTT